MMTIVKSNWLIKKLSVDDTTHSNYAQELGREGGGGGGGGGGGRGGGGGGGGGGRESSLYRKHSG